MICYTCICRIPYFFTNVSVILNMWIVHCIWPCRIFCRDPTSFVYIAYSLTNWCEEIIAPPIFIRVIMTILKLSGGSTDIVSNIYQFFPSTIGSSKLVHWGCPASIRTSLTIRISETFIITIKTRI